jgi:leucyl aminopeptidase
MRAVHLKPELNLSSEDLSALDVEILIVPCFESDNLADQSVLAEAVRDNLDRARNSDLFSGKPYETLYAEPGGSWNGRRVLIVGAGTRESWSTERARRVAITGGLVARGLRLTRIGLIVRGEVPDGPERLIQALGEGIVLANFDSGSHKTSGTPPSWIASATISFGDQGAGVREALVRGSVLGDYSNLARELANAPGNKMTPRVLASRAEAVAADSGLAVEILDEVAMADLGMGLLLGVARGSHEPPRLIVLRHDPSGAPETPVLGLIGKGVTFDTGGISLKPADKMERMKDDMSGGAAVIAAMGAIASLGVPVRCIGIVPATENMPGGDAVKPGDVLESAAGITVEVINTDAEGRLVLGDGLWYARRCGATHLVDVATLTGACVVALGYSTTGLFGVPEAWTDQVLAASTRAGDRAWPMPTFQDYREQLKSDVADMVNSASRDAGAITAAWFVGAFAGELPWAHLDIAGTAWAERALPYQPKGPTGAAVRTLVELARASVSWPVVSGS